MTQLLLIRHGQSEWNATGRWQGWADVELSAEGEDQAREAAARLAGMTFTAVVHSGMRRTGRTAELIADHLGVAARSVEPGLKEYDVGDWSGLTRPEIEERWPGALDRWFSGALPATPGGESRIGFSHRVMATLHRIAILHLGGRVLAVTHGGVVGLIQRELSRCADPAVPVGARKPSASAASPDGYTPRIANLSGRWVEADDCGGFGLGRLVHLLQPGHETVSPSA